MIAGTLVGAVLATLIGRFIIDGAFFGKKGTLCVSKEAFIVIFIVTARDLRT
jgi:hypothetical protein